MQGSVGAGECRCMGLDLKPSQDGEKDKKRRRKKRKTIVFGAGFELTTLRLQILHLTR